MTTWVLDGTSENKDSDDGYSLEHGTWEEAIRTLVDNGYISNTVQPPGARVPNWVSVKEALPSPMDPAKYMSDQVLIFDPKYGSGDVFKTAYYIFKRKAWLVHDCTSGNVRYLKTVTHWMPLTPPVKSKKEKS